MNTFEFIDFDTQTILPASAKWSGYESQKHFIRPYGHLPIKGKVEKQGTQRADHYYIRVRAFLAGAL